MNFAAITVRRTLAYIQPTIYTFAPNRKFTSAHSPNSDKAKPRVNDESQGHVIDPKNKHKKDVQVQAAKSAGEAQRRKDSGDTLDAASRNVKQKPQKNVGKGNPEGIGLVDQVGSASGSARQFEKKEK